MRSLPPGFVLEEQTDAGRRVEWQQAVAGSRGG